jgi:hypothetical protein
MYMNQSMKSATPAMGKAKKPGTKAPDHKATQPRMGFIAHALAEGRRNGAPRGTLTGLRERLQKHVKPHKQSRQLTSN